MGCQGFCFTVPGGLLQALSSQLVVWACLYSWCLSVIAHSDLTLSYVGETGWQVDVRENRGNMLKRKQQVRAKFIHCGTQHKWNARMKWQTVKTATVVIFFFLCVCVFGSILKNGLRKLFLGVFNVMEQHNKGSRKSLDQGYPALVLCYPLF